MPRSRPKINGLAPRKFYQKLLGEQIPEDFEVHHINGNKINNSPSNLVAIPKALHASFHRAQAMVLDIERTYQCKASTRNRLTADPRFSFEELTSGRWESWFEGTIEEFTSLCHKNNLRALFLDEIAPAYHNYKRLRTSVLFYKKQQDQQIELNSKTR